MKASTRERLEALEQAASMHGTRQLVILDVRTFSDVGRKAYWAGDPEALRQYGAPDRDQVPSGQIHTIVIDVHPDMCGPQLTSADLQDEDSELKGPNAAQPAWLLLWNRWRSGSPMGGARRSSR